MSAPPPRGGYTKPPIVYGVFVGNLDSSVTDMDLRREFAQCGTIVDCRIIRDSNGMSKKFGFVNFSTDEGRVKALDTMDHVVINGSAVNVRNKHNGVKESNKIIMKAGAHARDIYCGGIPLEVTGQEIKCQLENNFIQGIADVRVKAGYCFVSFISAEQASIGLETLRRGQVPTICGKPVEVQGNASKIQSEPFSGGVGAVQYQVPVGQLTQRQHWMAEKAARTLYVCNLGTKTTEQELQGLIAKYANIRQVTVVKDDVSGTNRGYGFVELETAEELQKVIAMKHQLTLDGQQLNVQVSRPPKEVQEALILQQTNQLMAQPQYFQDPSTGQFYMLNTAPQAPLLYTPPPQTNTAFAQSLPGGMLQPQFFQTHLPHQSVPLPPVPPPPGPPPPMSIPANVPLQGQRFSPY